MRTVENALKFYEEDKIKKANIVKWVKKMRPDIEQFKLFIYDESIALYIKTHELSKCRKVLRKYFKKYKDKISRISSYEICYDCNTDPKITITIQYNSIEEMPKSIFKNGKCGFTETTTTKKVFVCNTKED